MFIGTDFIFVGAAIDDFDTLRRVPAEFAELLSERNGFVCFRGGLHIRGAATQPSWHSLRDAWDGDLSLHQRYAVLQPNDVPFGEDCVGDQFLLRGEEVVQLHAETGEVEPTGLTFAQFLDKCDGPVEFLLMHPLLQLEAEGKSLQPGELIHAYPPFCSKEAAAGVSLRAVPSVELLAFHADLARTIGPLQDGDRIEIRVV